MLFNSLDFLVFFPVVTILYFILPHSLRSFFLLAASCYFYMSFIPVYILVIATLILIDYVCGILIERAQSPQKKNLCLVASIIATCLTLFIFKYFNFFNINVTAAAHLLHLNYPLKILQLLLPLGLSFHTFQSLSYVIEVYRGRQKAEYNLLIYALYVMFYPQLVAGPIERPQHLLHQFYEKHYFDYQRVTDGLKLMTWGYFKKLVIADRLAKLVNPVYADPHSYIGVSLLIATVLFAYQIYCDFSGYSDIAIGSAQVMGFSLVRNFDRPYAARSFSDFWKRWHISLSTWFRDYLYIPLGGNQCSCLRRTFNLFFTFLVSGLWHGANWTYLVWGALNGFYVITALWTQNIRDTMAHALRFKGSGLLIKYFGIFTTFALICFAWIFFRAKDMNDALYIASHLFSNPFSLPAIFHDPWKVDNYIFLGNTKEFLIGAVTIILMEIVYLLHGKGIRIRQWLSQKPVILRWVIYYLLVVVTLLYGHIETSEKFIYFQF